MTNIDDRSQFGDRRRQGFGQTLWPESPILLAYQQTENSLKGEVVEHEDMGYNNFDKCMVDFRGEVIGATCCHPEIVVGMPVSIIERPRGVFWATVFQNSWYSRPLFEVAQKGKPMTAALEYLISKCGQKWRPPLIMFDKDWSEETRDGGSGGGGGGFITTDPWDYYALSGGITLPRWIANDWPECIFHDFDKDGNALVTRAEWDLMLPKMTASHVAGDCFVRANGTFGKAKFSTFVKRSNPDDTGIAFDILGRDGGTEMDGYYLYYSSTDKRVLYALYALDKDDCVGISFDEFFRVAVHIPHTEEA